MSIKKNFIYYTNHYIITLHVLLRGDLMNQHNQGPNQTGFLGEELKRRTLGKKQRKPNFSVSNLSFIFTVFLLIGIILFIVYNLN